VTWCGCATGSATQPEEEAFGEVVAQLMQGHLSAPQAVRAFAAVCQNRADQLRCAACRDGRPDSAPANTCTPCTPCTPGLRSSAALPSRSALCRLPPAPLLGSSAGSPVKTARPRARPGRRRPRSSTARRARWRSARARTRWRRRLPPGRCWRTCTRTAGPASRAAPAARAWPAAPPRRPRRSASRACWRPRPT